MPTRLAHRGIPARLARRGWPGAAGSLLRPFRRGSAVGRVTFASMRGHRIGHDERTHVLGLLNGALEAGVLPVAEYDARVAQVGSATYAGELRDQLADLPQPYAWDEPPDPPPPAVSGRVALVLGIASVPLSICVLGGILGILAVLASRNATPAPGGPRINAALIGRIFGILGIVLSIGAISAILYARNNQLGP
ncbi:MAG TPA: DUF1707 domain-containing protein [Actinoplanes sp.]